jgi:pimeloyl-ACP methyl ester carboxylesterase
MGGAIAISAALKYPDRVAGLVLVSTGARLKVPPLFLKILKRKIFPGLVMKLFLLTAFPKESPKKAREIAKTMLQEAGSDVLYGDLSACSLFDKMNALAGIAVPTLILCGREDRLTPVKYSQYLHQKIKGSFLKIFDDAGHFLPQERPEEFTKEIVDWMSDLEKSDAGRRL